MATRNEKAVALFKEHLPPHIAELCIKEHENSCGLEGFEKLVNVDCETVEQAIHEACFWSSRPDRFIDLNTLYHSVTGNTFYPEHFYDVYPSLKPADPAPISGNEDSGVTGDEPFGFTVDEIIDAHLPIRESELQQSSNSEDKRDAMEEPTAMEFIEGLQTSIDMQKFFLEPIEEVKAAVWRADASNAARWDKCFAAIEKYNEDARQIGRNLEVIHNAQTEFGKRLDSMAQFQKLERSDVRTKLEQILTVKELKEEKASSTKSLVIIVGLVFGIDIVIQIIKLFI